MSVSASDAVWVLIPAAGIGKRMGSDIPKQYLTLNNQTVLEHTLQCFVNHPEVAGIIVALNEDDPYWKSLDIDNILKPIYTVEGGKERSDSVLQTLDYLLSVERVAANNWVMVHDAARPCLTQEDLNALLKLREASGVGGILASPVRDTMKRSQQNISCIEKTVSRENLWHALTPQLFRAGELKHALETCIEKGIEVTDESSAMEALGANPRLVEGSSTNIKITQPADLEYASWILSEKT